MEGKNRQHNGAGAKYPSQLTDSAPVPASEVTGAKMMPCSLRIAKVKIMLYLQMLRVI
jgi:hypothetical protein